MKELNREIRKDMIKCSRCKSIDIVKDGKKILSKKTVQRFQCKTCGYKFHV